MNIKRSAISIAVITALSSSIHAQDAENPSTETNAEDVEKIVVVGSHIRRASNFESKQPVQIVGQVDIARIGASQPIDLLKELTVNTGSRASDETGDSNGSSQINIRGLGFGSTLTLVNGRRAGISAISDTSGNEFVDINQFPLSMIKRIDVLTDGASAIYGSQAVAGVANIVTRKGFEGFEVTLDYRDSNTNSSSISFAAGHGFDRGHFNVYGTFYQQQSRYRGEIDFLDERLNGNGNQSNGSLISGTGSPGSYFRAIPDGSGGLTRDSATRYGDPDCLAAGGIFRQNEAPANPNDTLGVTCRLNFFDQVSPIRDEERVQIYTEFDYDLTDDVKFIHESHYSQNTALGHAGPNFIGNGSATGGGWVVPGTHPFNFYVDDGAGGISYAGPDAFAADPTLAAVDIIAQFRPFGENAAGDNFGPFQETYGDQKRRTDFNYFRMVNGLEIELGGEGDWYANISHSLSINRFNDGEGNFYIVDRLDELLRDGKFNPFGTAVVNPGLISPKDGASTSVNEAETVALFNSRRNNVGRTKEEVIDFIASGALFDLDIGTISGAFGAQSRKTKLDFSPDSLLAAGEGNDNSRDFQIGGEQDVWAVFGEVIIPINDLAEIQVALRHEEYGGNVGSTTDPKIGVKVEPTDWLTVRGSWGTSFQAPTIRQTARAVSSGFLDDPASTGDGPQNATCVNKGIAAAISVVVEGSPSLGPQSADSFTLGFVFDVGNALVSVDGWSYDYEGVIAAGQGAQSIVNDDCTDDGIPNDPRVTRDGAGFLQSVTTSFENIDDVKASGVDVALRYDFEPGDNGYFVLDSKVSYLNKMEINGDLDAVGSRNFGNFVGPQPQIRANGSLSWLSDSQTVSLSVRYVDSYDNDQSNNAEIEDFTTLDFNYAYTFDGLIGDNDTVLSFGINNVLDEDPPALRTADVNGNIITQEQQPIGFVNRPGYDDRSGVNLLGRTVFLRVNHSF
jgi:iron complex outermembrane receptor protein